MDGNRVGLDVDGVELPDAAAKPDSVSRTFTKLNNSYGMGRDYIDPEMFREVRIQAGSTDARTDGLAGRVSFLTKKASDYVNDNKTTAAGYKIGYDGADKSVQHAAHGAVGSDTLRALVVYSRRDGEEVQANTNIALEPNDWRSDAALLNVQYQPNDHHEVSAVVDYYNKSGTLNYDADSTSSLYPNGGTQDSDIKRLRYGLEYTYTPDNATGFDRLNAHAFYQTAENSAITTTDYSGLAGAATRVFDTTLNTDTYGLKLLADKFIAGDRFNHDIQYGLDGSRTNEERPWKQSATTNGVTTVTQNNRMPSMETDKFAVHISNKITTDINGHELTIAPQLRYVYQKHKPTDLSNYLSLSQNAAVIASEEVKETTNDYVSPGLTLAYKFGPEVLGYAKYNRSARLPTSSEKAGAYDGGRFYAVVGNPELEAETSDAFELGFKGELTDGIEFALSGFYNKYRNYIDYRNDSDVPAGYMFLIRAQNVADVDIWGGELGLKMDLGKFIPNSDGFSMVLGAGTSDYKAADSDGEKTYIDSILPAKVTLGFSYDAPSEKFGLGLTSTFVKGKQSDSSSTSFYAKGYNNQDFAAYWNINKNTRLNVGLNNIFNQKYWDYTAVSGLLATDTTKIERATNPERNVTASLEFKF
ncbi:hypothetical protein AAX06_07095 [Moraxella bovoculi]|uniref:TonB-dependent receptor-like beta-barrel domain-containing protein n=2 Tax=Moraxella bovoculi TaxID=386891 RepID=A0AAC8PVV4_9GAMM|nr:hypothetical protein AAX06_07095 [Moraxella bovoculi]AKG11319.1 hypothetical protein AAX07_04185 [Moraxella bovoculi]